MKKRLAAFTAVLIAASLLITPVTAMAAPDTMISLGNDLSAEEKQEVLALLHVNESDLNDSNTVYVTNAEEHDYLEAYIAASVIGTRALSSCKIEKAPSGSGISVETHNITYCTPAMYENALATAGVKDANLVVAGPFALSGTAALVGAIKGYGKMTGTEISPELIDASTDELITATIVAENVGDSQKVSELIAAVKQIVAEKDFETDEDIMEAIDDVAAQMEIRLSQEDRELLLSLLKKLDALNLDRATIEQQAKSIYEDLKSGNLDLTKYGLTSEEQSGLFALIGKFFGNLFGSLTTWIRSLFG